MFVPTPKVIVKMTGGFSVSRHPRARVGRRRFMAAVEKRYGRKVRGYEVNPSPISSADARSFCSVWARAWYAGWTEDLRDTAVPSATSSQHHAEAG